MIWACSKAFHSRCIQRVSLPSPLPRHWVQLVGLKLKLIEGSVVHSTGVSRVLLCKHPWGLRVRIAWTSSCVLSMLSVQSGL